MDYAIARQMLAAIEARNPVDLGTLHGTIQLLEGAEARLAVLEVVAVAARAVVLAYEEGGDISFKMRSLGDILEELD